ncbi:very short patch repair endonuclease [Aestuariispira ectoiniformans]|uniref:very short patch repair endonuclease n=1 Tax=Aestuariispira ectoiniformans TaxID=2775080 RepID=UPI00223C260B|nr:DNA mismatch endonuclease Vsr [Aestuariispira ectoiniformans]
MVDFLNPIERSERMSRIRGKDTKPEFVVRQLLHANGFRYRLHRKDLPGRPDLVLPKHKLAIFVHGCFWHAHNCHIFTMPKTKTAFWKSKFQTNIERDIKNRDALVKGGWRVLYIWECAISGKTRLANDELFRQFRQFLKSQNLDTGEIEGSSAKPLGS